MDRVDAELPEAPDPDEVESPSRLSVDYADIDRGALVGEGASATVHEARVERRRVALKEPRVDGTLHTDQVRAFVREAETWERLDDHPGVVRVLDWGERPLPWLALEFMDGGSLADRPGAPSTEEALWIAVRVARAIRHAHRHGVAHLDLRPENVLFSTAGSGWDVPKVTDWGVARRLLDGAGPGGRNPQYGAPEQFDPDRFGDPDDRTDVYGLGAVTFAALTGRPPRRADGARAVEAAIDGDPPRPSDHADGLPEGVDRVVGRAMATDPDDRYEAVIDLRRALQSLLRTAAGLESAGGTARHSPDPGGPNDDAPGAAGGATSAAVTPDLRPSDAIHDGITCFAPVDEESVYGFAPDGAIDRIRREWKLRPGGDLPATRDALDRAAEDGDVLFETVLAETAEFVGLTRPVRGSVAVPASVVRSALDRCGYDPATGDAEVLVPEEPAAPFVLRLPRAPPELLAHERFGDVDRVGSVDAPPAAADSVCLFAPWSATTKHEAELAADDRGINGAPGEPLLSYPENDAIGFVAPGDADATLRQWLSSAEPHPEGLPDTLEGIGRLREAGEYVAPTVVAETPAGIVSSKTERTRYKLDPGMVLTALSLCEYTPERYDADAIDLYRPVDPDGLFVLDLDRSPREAVAYGRHGDVSAVDRIDADDAAVRTVCLVAPAVEETTD